jgi:hypothetical protein
MTTEVAAPWGCRAWQFSPALRIARVVCFAAVLTLPASYLWLTLWTNGVAHAGWIVLACWGLALPWPAWRSWTQAVTLTPDELVIRNIFQTERVALTDITAVTFRGRVVSITEARPPSRLMGTVPAAPSVTPSGGRHGYQGERYKIGALGLGNGYWSGRAGRADDAADAIAAAAGLPPLPRRKPVIGRRSAGVLPFVGLALVVSGTVMPRTHGGLRDAMFGALLTSTGFAFFWPSVYAAYDHYIRRDSRRRWRSRRPG